MTDDYLLIQRRKLAASMRASRRLERRLDDIQWEREVLAPELEKLEQRILRGERPDIKALEPSGV